MEDIHNRSTSPLQDAEESVRTLVSRLEFGHMQSQSKPRIIESRCIEKHTEPVRSAQQQEQSPLQSTAQSLLVHETPEELARLKPVADLIAQVTVNNHISFASPALVAASVKQQAPSAQRAATEKEKSTPAATAKVGRNRNVDLALSMSANANATKEHLKGTAQTTAVALTVLGDSHKHAASAIQHTPQQQQQQHQVSTKNARNLISGDEATASSSAATTTTSTLVAQASMQMGTKRNGGGGGNVPQSNDVAADDAENGAGSVVGPRLVKWNTLSKFDEKNYVTNDAKLKLKPKYDEIEFEEFEVFDPNNPQPNSECYDSLNDK